jgi:hypothetical protein
MAVKIRLSTGQLCLVDEDMIPVLTKYNRYGRKEGKNVYAAVSAKGSEGTLGKKIRMHRLILDASSGQIVDHINGNTLDNRKCNLRIVTHLQNMANVGKRSGRYRGVSYSKKDRHWRARIGLSGLPGIGRQCEIHLGCYKTAKEAAMAYNLAAQEWFGPYARLNEVR